MSTSVKFTMFLQYRRLLSIKHVHLFLHLAALPMNIIVICSLFCNKMSNRPVIFELKTRRSAEYQPSCSRYYRLSSVYIYWRQYSSLTDAFTDPEWSCVFWRPPLAQFNKQLFTVSTIKSFGCIDETHKD